MDPKEAWLRDEIDDTHYFPDEYGHFNLGEEGISPYTTLIVETSDVTVAASSTNGTSSSSRSVTAGGGHGPSSSLNSMTPTFKSVTTPQGLKTKSYNLKIIRASMTMTGRTAHFQHLRQTLEMVDSTANLEYVVTLVQKRWGPEYVIVTNDGLKLEESPATQGRPIIIAVPRQGVSMHQPASSYAFYCRFVILEMSTKKTLCGPNRRC